MSMPSRTRHVSTASPCVTWPGSGTKSSRPTLARVQQGGRSCRALQMLAKASRHSDGVNDVGSCDAAKETTRLLMTMRRALPVPPASWLARALTLQVVAAPRPSLYCRQPRHGPSSVACADLSAAHLYCPLLTPQGCLAQQPMLALRKEALVWQGRRRGPKQRGRSKVSRRRRLEAC